MSDDINPVAAGRIDEAEDAIRRFIAHLAVVMEMYERMLTNVFDTKKVTEEMVKKEKPKHGVNLYSKYMHRESIKKLYSATTSISMIDKLELKIPIQKKLNKNISSVLVYLPGYQVGGGPVWLSSVVPNDIYAEYIILKYQSLAFEFCLSAKNLAKQKQNFYVDLFYVPNEHWSANIYRQTRDSFEMCAFACGEIMKEAIIYLMSHHPNGLTSLMFTSVIVDMINEIKPKIMPIINKKVSEYYDMIDIKIEEKNEELIIYAEGLRIEPMTEHVLSEFTMERDAERFRDWWTYMREFPYVALMFGNSMYTEYDKKKERIKIPMHRFTTFKPLYVAGEIFYMHPTIEDNEITIRPSTFVYVKKTIPIEKYIELMFVEPISRVLPGMVFLYSPEAEELRKKYFGFMEYTILSMLR